MKVRVWMERMVILDLLAVALLLFVRGFVEPAVDAHSAAVVQAGEVQGQIGTGKEWNGVQVQTETGQQGRPLTQDNTGQQGKVALTFDDGPHPKYTEELLDGLKERGVHVTFFVTGEHAEQYPELIRRMSDEGHLIGNHTYSHIQLKKNNHEKFKEELIRTNEIISGITGRDVTFVRPPYGTWEKKFETELNMFPVLWNIDPLDWCSDNADCVSRKVLSKVKENDIILLHDQYESSVQAALAIIDAMQKEGYEFVTVEEILFD